LSRSSSTSGRRRERCVASWPCSASIGCGMNGRRAGQNWRQIDPVQRIGRIGLGGRGGQEVASSPWYGRLTADRAGHNSARQRPGRHAQPPSGSSSPQAADERKMETADRASGGSPSVRRCVRPLARMTLGETGRLCPDSTLLSLEGRMKSRRRAAGSTVRG